jgi:hypothetical protein
MPSQSAAFLKSAWLHGSKVLLLLSNILLQIPVFGAVINKS